MTFNPSSSHFCLTSSTVPDRQRNSAASSIGRITDSTQTSLHVRNVPQTEVQGIESKSALAAFAALSLGGDAVAPFDPASAAMKCATAVNGRRWMNLKGLLGQFIENLAKLGKVVFSKLHGVSQADQYGTATRNSQT
jgi:hypothetical protein